MRYRIPVLLLLVLLIPVAPTYGSQINPPLSFNGSSAYNYLVEQCDFGPRPPGSENLSDCRQFIRSDLESQGWIVSLQNFTYRDTGCSNIIARWTNSSSPPLLLGAHYDTRPNATADVGANKTKPILGANDGASGTAVLLELARTLPESVRSLVELVFFDAEDSGDINGWAWIRGSTYYVSELSASRKSSIHAMILVDMIGDANLQIPKESSSTDSLQNDVWNIADSLGYSGVFLDSGGYSVLDDHSPFLNAGVPALDLIQVPFPWYWHTLEDTPDKCSNESLQVVGRVLESFISEYNTESSTYALDQPYLLYGLLVVFSLLVLSIVYLRLKR